MEGGGAWTDGLSQPDHSETVRLPEDTSKKGMGLEIGMH